MPTGFVKPSPSTQESGHGYTPMAVPDTSPFTEAPEKSGDFDGYGGDNKVTGDYGRSGDGYGYDTKVK
jgi:hypothetical protein